MNPLHPAPPIQVERPSRADARRNFDRLVAAADAVYTEHGVDAPLDDIAKRAGVGSGTLYRHFPSRDALISAVIWERISALCRQGDELLNADSSVEALRAWLRSMIDLTMRRGLAVALIASAQDRASDLFAACHHALETSAAPLLERAQRDGSVRPDLTLTDLLTFAHAIASSIERSPERDERADRMLSLLLEGLTANPAKARTGE